MFAQPVKIVNVLLERVRILLRLRGEAAADMIRRNDAIFLPKFGNQLAVIK